jgi:hypothetical protein
MTLASDLAYAVKDLFNYAASLTTSITYHSALDPPATYTTGTGGVGHNSTPIAVTDALFVEFRTQQIDGVDVLPTDQILVLQASSLGAAVPKVQDWVIDGSSRRWNVVRVHKEPSASLYWLQVRTSGG